MSYLNLQVLKKSFAGFLVESKAELFGRFLQLSDVGVTNQFLAEEIL